MKPQVVPSLYSLKALGALFVVMCHTPMQVLGDSMSLFKTSAVPVFFAISGYFLYQDEVNATIKRAWQGIKNIIPIIFIVNLIHVIGLLPNHSDQLTWEALYNTILLGSGYAGHLWYLTAFLQGLFVIIILLRLFPQRAIMYLPLLLLPLNIIQGKYSDLTGLEANVFTVIHHGLPFLSLGYIMAWKQDKILKYKWGLCLVASIGLWLLESSLMRLYGISGLGIYISSFLYIPATIGLCLQYKGFGASTWLEKIGKNYSGCIYYFHILVAVIVAKVIHLIGLTPLYEQIGSILVFIASLIVAIGIQITQNRLGIKLLR